MPRTILTLYAILSLISFAGYGKEARAPLALFNGRDLTGWTFHLDQKDTKQEDTWNVKDGVMACTGSPSGYLRTTEKYRDYQLTVEWRWPGKGGNNGVLVHVQEPDTVWPKSIEAQMQHEHAGDIWVIGGATFKEHQGVAGRRVAKQEISTEKPLGEWNTFTIVAKGNTLLIYVNGVLQNVATECTLSEGYIALQSEGRAIEYRTVSLLALGME